MSSHVSAFTICALLALSGCTQPSPAPVTTAPGPTTTAEATSPAEPTRTLSPSAAPSAAATRW